jgi:O-acetyl-ADP-ribose deacetylase
MAVPIDVWQGEIAELEVDALVVSASESLFMTSGAAASVRRRGGDVIERAAVEQGPVPVGSAVVTGAGALAASYVIHVVAVGHDRRGDPDALSRALDAALAVAEPLQLRRMAFALIGVEHGAFTTEDAARVLVRALLDGAGTLESAVIATASPGETRAVADALSALRQPAP